MTDLEKQVLVLKNDYDRLVEEERDAEAQKLKRLEPSIFDYANAEAYATAKKQWADKLEALYADYERKMFRAWLPLSKRLELGNKI